MSLETREMTIKAVKNSLGRDPEVDGISHYDDEEGTHFIFFRGETEHTVLLPHTMPMKENGELFDRDDIWWFTFEDVMSNVMNRLIDWKPELFDKIDQLLHEEFGSKTMGEQNEDRIKKENGFDD